MKLEKAIELNKEVEESLRAKKYLDFADAVKLGNEALKGYRIGRTLPGGQFFFNLPSESEE